MLRAQTVLEPAKDPIVVLDGEHLAALLGELVLGQLGLREFAARPGFLDARRAQRLELGDLAAKVPDERRGAERDPTCHLLMRHPIDYEVLDLTRA